ncbi:MAG: hypothetical protein ORN26_02235 [Candidatus Pacebacteria bacterium]|nr:hypothetical protein [Candidatus Paceibacterota bacterium]
MNSNFIIAAGATATVEVRADTFSNNTNVAYTAGTLSAGTLSGTAYGNGSNGSGASGLTSTINAGSIRSLTLGAAQGSLGLVGATSKTLSPNINGENIGSVTFSAGQNEAVTLNQVNVTLDTSADANGLGLAGLTNITLKNGNNIVGSIYPTAGPVSNLNQPATTLTFSANSITVPVNGSITLDLIADIGNVATNFSVVTNANVQYRGNTSQVTGTSAQTANVTTTFAAAVFTNPTLSGATPLTQFLVGGSTQNVAKFSVKTSTGQTNIQELYFLVNQGGSTLVNSLTFNGVSYPVINNRVTVTGLNLPVNSSAQDISVQANTACFGYTGNCNSNAVTPNSFTVSLTGIKSTQSSVATIGSNGGTALVTGNTMSVVSSKPTVAIANSSVGISSGRQQLAQVTVTADSAGSIYVKKLSFNTNISTVASGGATVSNVFLSDDNGNTPLTGFSAAIASVTSGTPYAFTNAAG